MNLLKYYDRSRCPQGFWGRRVLKAMNGEAHGEMPNWALDALDLPGDVRMLDIGCGGGANMRRLLQRYPDGTVTGIDHSPLALDYAYNLNYNDMMVRCIVLDCAIEGMLLGKESFDLVTAFETIYYWTGIEDCLSRIHRVIKPGGVLLIANELDGDNDAARSLELKSKDVFHIYPLSELTHILSNSGFGNIIVKRDDARHFINVTCHKL